MATNGNGGSRLSLRWLYVAWLGFAFVMFAFMVAGFVERGDPTPLIERISGDVSLFAFWVYSVGQAVAALVLWSLLRKNKLGWRSVGLTGRMTRRAAVYAVVGWFVGFWLFYLVDLVCGYAGIQMFWNEGEFFGLDSVLRAVTIPIATVIIAPVAEEIIYRGYVLSALLARIGTRTAVTLSCLIFASVHLGVGPGLSIYVFIGAFILAYLYLRFRNVYPCILMHVLNNVAAYLIIPLFVGPRT